MTINRSGNPSINLVAQSKYDPEWIPGAHSKERDKGNAEETQAANERADMPYRRYLKASARDMPSFTMLLLRNHRRRM